MICSLCGGLVTWRGPLSNLTHTECENCGTHNCQEVDLPSDDDGEEADTTAPAPGQEGGE